MAKFTFLLILATVGYIGYHLYGKKLARQGPSAWIKPAVIVLIALLILAVATGRANAIFALIGAALAAAWRVAPLLLRYAPQIKGLFKRFNITDPNAKQHSTVQTRTLTMILNHSTGEFDGNITQGEFTGRSLSSLNQTELKQFALFCRSQDSEGMKLLHSFASRYRPNWDVQADADIQAPNLDMSTDEALNILGLASDATKQDVVTAHRRLMSRLHPDKGGTDYLASKINQAKNLLMKNTQ